MREEKKGNPKPEISYLNVLSRSLSCFKIWLKNSFIRKNGLTLICKKQVSDIFKIKNKNSKSH